MGTERTRILIDAGISRRETLKRLEAIGEDPAKLNAIFVTHEHSDHVCGLASLARLLDIPVYLTHLTAPSIDWKNHVPKLEAFQAGTRIELGDLTVDSFTIPHDAVDPVGYAVTGQGVKASFVTDLGYMPESIRFHLRESQFLLLECNHDLEMLRVGPYPWSVKQRVMGRRGHLSNDVVQRYLQDELAPSVAHLVLGHISEHNNHPALVRRMADRALEGRHLFTKFEVAEPGRALEPVVF